MSAVKKAICTVIAIGALNACTPQSAEAREQAQLRRQIEQKEQEILQMQDLFSEKFERASEFHTQNLQRAISFVHCAADRLLNGPTGHEIRRYRGVHTPRGQGILNPAEFLLLTRIREVEAMELPDVVIAFRSPPSIRWTSPATVSFTIDHVAPRELRGQLSELNTSIRETTNAKNALREQYRLLNMTPEERIRHNQQQIQRQTGR